MRHLPLLLGFGLFALLFIQPAPIELAQQVQDDDAKPLEFKKEELEAAGKYLKAVGGERALLINGLRYLIEPGYELPLMRGRAYVQCALPPFYAKNDSAMELLESLRLLVILESGMPLDETVERDIVRFLNTETHRVDDSLANYAVPMLVCLSATRNKEIKHTKLLKEKAEDLMRLAMNARDVTAETSPLIKQEFIEPMWFANQMWRALMCRCCTELDIRYNVTVWQTNLMDLSGACLAERGWTSTKTKNRNPNNDLNSNLLAVAAVSLALQAPENVLSNGTVHSLEKRLKYMPEILKRLVDDYPDEKYLGGRLLLVRSFRDDFAPKRRTWKEWYAELQDDAIAEIEPSGAIEAKHNLANALGLDVGMAPRYARKAAETALCCLALCGGLFHDKDFKKPLEGMSKAQIDAAMQSLSLLHAAWLPPLKKAAEDGDLESEQNLPLDERVEIAIERGCRQLEKIQQSDGSFLLNGHINLHMRNEYETAMCLAALINGDRKQDSPAVSHAMNLLISRLTDGVPAFMTTYEVGMILYGIQAYYTKTSEEAGIRNVKSANDYGKVRMKTWANIPQGHKAVIETLTRFLTDAYVGGTRGGWGYDIPPAKGTAHSDNSCSQFGMLGYKAAAVLGAPTDIKIFQNEADRLVAQYGAAPGARTVDWRKYDDGDEYVTNPFPQPTWISSIKAGGWSYGCGPSGGAAGVQYNGAGMMGLAMARDELLLRNAMHPGQRMKIDMAMFGAQAWLADNFYARSEMLPKRGFFGTAGSGLLYNMWAMERGCVTANYPLLDGKVDWYAIMAEGLVDGQAADGSWGTPHDTAVAILILRKAAPFAPSNPQRRPEVRKKPTDPLTGGPKPTADDDPIDPVTGNRKKKRDVTKGEDPEDDDPQQPEKQKPDDPVTGR